MFRDSYGNGMGIAFSDLGKLGKEASVLDVRISRAKKKIWGANHVDICAMVKSRVSLGINSSHLLNPFNRKPYKSYN